MPKASTAGGTLRSNEENDMQKNNLFALMLVSAICLTGCTAAPSVVNEGTENNSAESESGISGESEDQTASTESTDAPDKEEESESDEQEEENNSDENEETDSEDEDEDEDEVVLYASSLGGKVYVVDGNGSLKHSYDLDEIVGKLASKGLSLNVYEFRKYCDGLLYFTKYFQRQDYSYSQAVIAVNPDTLNYATIYETKNDQYLSVIDAYKGAIRLFIVENGEVNKAYGYAIDVDEDTLSCKISNNLLSGFYDVYSGYDFDFYYSEPGDAQSPDEMIDERGFIIGKKDSSYYMIDGEGSANIVDGLDADNTNIITYDDKYIIYKEMGESGNYDTTNYLNLSTGEKKKFLDTAEFSGLQMEDGCLYYYINQEVEYGINNYTLFRYDFNSDKMEKLDEKMTVPGVHDYIPYSYGFDIAGNNVFLTGIDDGEIGWYMVDAKADDFGSMKNIGYPIKTISTYDYGEVDYRSETYTCPYCGKEVEKEYIEHFILDSEYSEYADKINSQLFDTDYGADTTTAENITEEECKEWHGDDVYQYVETYDYNITNVKVLEGRFLLVGDSSYFYGGGAHGMPGMSQSAFDLTTGDAINIETFYKGSEDEFKELIAKKTKEDYESKAGGENPYFAENSEEAYESALESANFRGCIMFEEDGIRYYFYPYDMGPFASGFIDVFVSYEELFGRKTLSE